MEPNSQLTYEIDYNVGDVMKRSNLNMDSREMQTGNNQSDNTSYYSSYKEYLNSKFGGQAYNTEMNDKLHQLNNKVERRSPRYGDRNYNMSFDNNSMMRRNHFDPMNNSDKKLNIEVTPYSPFGRFSNANAMGTNPFNQNRYSNGNYDNQRESRNGNGYGYLNSNTHQENDDELMAGSKTNYGRNRVNAMNEDIDKDCNNSKEMNKEGRDLVNSALYKSIPNLQSIKHLPLEEQVVLLFNENQALKGKVEELSNNYSLLQKENNELKTQKEGDQINNKNKLNDFLIKNNKELQEKNKENEALFEDLISLANEINQAKGNSNEMLTLDQIKQSPEHLKQMLARIREEVFEEDNNEKHDKHGGALVIRGLKKKKNKNAYNESSEGSKSNNTNSYYRYNNKSDCFPCSLGISNSNKGYSPRMCSPNKDNYSQKEDAN